MFDFVFLQFEEVQVLADGRIKHQSMTWLLSNINPFYDTEVQYVGSPVAAVFKLCAWRVLTNPLTFVVVALDPHINVISASNCESVMN